VLGGLLSTSQFIGIIMFLLAVVVALTRRDLRTHAAPSPTEEHR
jgi:hypothetical protein